MFFVLFIAATLLAVGNIVFKRFEAPASLLRGVLKFAFFMASTALVSYFAGELWGIVWVMGLFTLGMVVHFWWTLSHGIHPITAEPRAKYYALRGWEL